LEARARELGVEDHVVFFDQFVDQATLLDFISMCDVYVTPYLSESQMTSGTLAYSFGGLVDRDRRAPHGSSRWSHLRSGPSICVECQRQTKPGKDHADIFDRAVGEHALHIISHYRMGACLCETPDDLGKCLPQPCGGHAGDNGGRGEASDRDGKTGAAPLVWLWRGSPDPQRQGRAACCAGAPPGGETTARRAGGGQSLKRGLLRTGLKRFG
jgi:hypothetical protein